MGNYCLCRLLYSKIKICPAIWIRRCDQVHKRTIRISQYIRKNLLSSNFGGSICFDFSSSHLQVTNIVKSIHVTQEA